MNIAMWSGPRNLSTALMYSFAQRADTTVTDEPFYAAYLAATGADHPMRAEILTAQNQDYATIAAASAAPGPRSHRYLKLMTHHMIAVADHSFMGSCRNAFLIRHPARVLASYVAKRERPSLQDIGFTEQFALYRTARALGQTPIVVDSADIRQNPPAMLASLCAALGLPFDPAMLSWPEGGNLADGVWARHWYGAVHRSTCFAGPEGPLPDLPDDLAAVAAAALPIYEELAASKLSV
ncbi:MAG: HAD family hydrolase [Pseudomonadota bacterium]